jgi:2-polyprenyl-3-methyl-5-hydroxy-6-metoxy-1,4-benzoquinol methylase
MNNIKDFYNELEFPGRYTKQQMNSYDFCPSNTYLKFIHQHLADGMNVLDAGCGTGLITNLFATRFKSKFVAVDFANSINYGRRYAQQNNIQNVEWLQQDLVDYTSAEKFDVIICQGVLHHIPNYQQALENLKKCLAPGGVLLLGLYHPLGKFLQKLLPIRYVNKILKTDQISNPFELSFTKYQAQQICCPLALQNQEPSTLFALRQSWIASGGLIIYSFRK